jgi:DNA-binding MarR family transcriptional regulator
VTVSGGDDQSVSALLRRFALQRELWLGSLCRRLDVSRSDVSALDALEQLGPRTPTELGELLCLTSASVTALVDRLERQGWAVRDDHPGDRRKIVVTLTAIAHETRSREFQPYLDAIDEAVARLAPTDRAVVVTFLDDLLRGITSADLLTSELS